MKMKKIGLSSLNGREERWLPSSTKSIWMEGKASSFLGIQSTDRFTRKHCGITWIPAKRGSSLFTLLNQSLCQELRSLKSSRQQAKIRDKRLDYYPVFFSVCLDLALCTPFFFFVLYQSTFTVVIKNIKIQLDMEVQRTHISE